MGIILISIAILLSPMIRRRYSRWGATNDELRQLLPGDQLVPEPKTKITCALDIEASCEQVWSWLLQLGYRRGGWYSYDLLDNQGEPSAVKIIPQYQHLHIDDLIVATPSGSISFIVDTIDQHKSLVFRNTTAVKNNQRADRRKSSSGNHFKASLSFVLSDSDKDYCRLVYRRRVNWNKGIINNLYYRFIMEPVSFIMTRKMLLGIRARTIASIGR